MANTTRFGTSGDVLPFDQIPSEIVPQAGGKGGVLARLLQAGYPVPDGFVILPAAFKEDELREGAWEQAKILLNALRIADNSGVSFAVRSSALAEDSAQASFAGEFETVLDVRSDEEVRRAIGEVRRSRHSERVQAYSQAKGVSGSHQVAVVVQRLLASKISGVLFSADPVSGSHAQMVGNFVHGLGDKLVSGQADAASFSLSRPGGRYQGPPELKAYATRLYKLARRLEAALGGPQDIEWAIANKQLYLLQSRPVTTLVGHNPQTGEWNASFTGDYLWSNVNFGEAVTEAMTPLTWSLIQFTLEDWTFIPGYATTGNIGGCPYLNISLFASLFYGLGRNRQSLMDTLEGTLFMRLPETMEIPRVPLSRLELLPGLWNMSQMAIKQNRGLKQLPHYLSANPAWFNQTLERLVAETSQAGLLDMWQDEIGPHIKRGVWIVLGTANNSSDYAIALRRDLSRLVGPHDANLLIANLSSSDDLLPSLGPLAGLSKVAGGEMDRADYLERYGHRGPHEFEVSVPRPIEDPIWLDSQLEQFKNTPVDIGALLANQRAAFEAAWGRFTERYPRQSGRYWRRIQESARRARLREQARSEYIRDRWMARKFALRAAELTGLGQDIFFLSLAEILAFLAGDSAAVPYIPARKETYSRYKALPPLPSVIRGRFDPFRWAADPQRRVDIFDAASPLAAAAADDPDMINGCAGSAGRAEGLVRFLSDPAEGHTLQDGEILVAVQTDIAWTLLFPRAAAVVTDIGAPLSHAAIVARELGIPAVVGCGDASQRLQTGDRVLVDGGKGVVKVIRTN